MSRRTFLNHCLRRASLPLLAPWAAPMAQAADKTWHILMITFRGEKHLRLVGQPSKALRVKDAVAVALKTRTVGVGFLADQTTN